MAYLKVIEETTTWVCPKTADYKVICVAGGCIGGVSSFAWDSASSKYIPANILAKFGEPTSFGSYLTASGSLTGTPYVYRHDYAGSLRVKENVDYPVYTSGPLKGFSLHNSNYGQGHTEAIKIIIGASSTAAHDGYHTDGLWTFKTLEGYGAGGNSIFDTVADVADANSTVTTVYNGDDNNYSIQTGSCGKLIMEIINIAAGVEVVCTVGRSVYTDVALAAKIKTCVGYSKGAIPYGSPGVIVIQEV